MIFKPAKLGRKLYFHYGYQFYLIPFLTRNPKSGTTDPQSLWKCRYFRYESPELMAQALPAAQLLSMPLGSLLPQQAPGELAHRHFFRLLQRSPVKWDGILMHQFSRPCGDHCLLSGEEGEAGAGLGQKVTLKEMEGKQKYLLSGYNKRTLKFC